MGKLVAIGGCRIEVDSEALKIHKEIVMLTGKKRPRLLFDTTPSGNPAEYYTLVPECFGKKLNCKIDFINVSNKITATEIRKKILSSDIFYVCGGNPFKLLKKWKKHGVDRLLRLAHKKGKVLAGVSAGAVCWFRYASPETAKPLSTGIKIRKLAGMNMANIFFCPHFNHKKKFGNPLKLFMRDMPLTAIACEDSCALEIVNEKYRIISTKKSANAYKVFWKDGKYYQELIKKKKEFTPLRALLKI